MAEKRQDKVEGVSPQSNALVPKQHRVERAAGEFRRGVPVVFRTREGRRLIFVPAETLTQELWAHLAEGAEAPPLLLLTRARAATLKIRLYTPDIVGIRLEAGIDVKRIKSIADPASDLENPLKGPFDTMREPLPDCAAPAVKLAKLAGLLPSVLILTADAMIARNDDLVELATDDIAASEAEAARDLHIVARARLPLDGAENCELVSFRPADGGPEHHAILIGMSGGKGLATPGPVLARLHSECFTGDLLGSLRCDCGDQLRGAVRLIAASGGGVLLYLAQEGRGIGLMNKLRAYRLQDQGFDTIEANERLGFEADERLYDFAARMFTLLGYRSVRLLTNNPEKIRALEAAGITVTERVPHSFPDNVHNRDYLNTKAKRSGHLL
ncbi:MAG: cyclohydrolase [Pseudomonadota bacterium]|jgi:GTP cyclohydrolase II